MASETKSEEEAGKAKKKGEFSRVVRKSQLGGAHESKKEKYDPTPVGRPQMERKVKTKPESSVKQVVAGPSREEGGARASGGEARGHLVVRRRSQGSSRGSGRPGAGRQRGGGRRGVAEGQGPAGGREAVGPLATGRPGAGRRQGGSSKGASGGGATGRPK
ncbi:uncharacterized protein LOC131856988 [Cryptomeria japonica]|uniref:uncharacterized protein LOC131856988 n=1 Tax=Cryptomeria japonica TaxID=3369 RepID=UPI0027D9E514|nr:uncharacterized protein LOC131856988 [Cryptomeria japonica]